jgi:DNA-binding response OmpR family regulator
VARILVIDDEEPIRSLMKKALERQGHQVEEAPDGSVGIQLFGESRFDLVITDLLMPEKEGIETLLDLKELDPDVKTLVVSGGLSFRGRALDKYGPLEDAEALGADATLSKPFEIRELVDAVAELLGDS